MKILLALVLSLPLFAAAQESSTISNPTVTNEAAVSKDIEFEAQFTTVSMSPRTTLGPSIAYRFSDSNQIGLRLAVPYQNSDDISVMTYSAFFRHNFNEGNSSLFTELGLGYNQIGNQNSYQISSDNVAYSAEVNIGALYRINHQLGFGALAGVIVADAHVTADSADTATSFDYAYPHLAVFANMLF